MPITREEFIVALAATPGVQYLCTRSYKDEGSLIVAVNNNLLYGWWWCDKTIKFNSESNISQNILLPGNKIEF